MEGNVVIFDRGNHRVGFASSNLTDPETGRPCGKCFTFILSSGGPSLQIRLTFAQGCMINGDCWLNVEVDLVS